MLPAAIAHMSYPEYLALEADSATKHEYLAGEVFAMAGGSIALDVDAIYRDPLAG